MKPFRIPLLIMGILVCLSGLLFAAQGAGLFPYPRSSFMISQSLWIYRGLGLAIMGAVLAGIGATLR